MLADHVPKAAMGILLLEEITPGYDVELYLLDFAGSCLAASLHHPSLAHSQLKSEDVEASPFLYTTIRNLNMSLFAISSLRSSNSSISQFVATSRSE
jgi:hypothetical protein